MESLPADLRDRATATPGGRVILDARLERALAERALEAVEPLAAAGKLATLLLQLSPAFAPGRHRLGELEPLLAALAAHPVAVELRHRGWLEGERLEQTLDWYEQAGAAFVCVDLPPGPAPTMVPALDAVTRPDVAYLRAHGRNAHGYLHGTTVAERFGWRYTDDELRELVGRARGLADSAREVRMMFNNNRGSDAPVAAARTRQLLGRDFGAHPAEGAQLRLDGARG